MFKPDKTNNETFEAHKACNEKRTRRITIGVIALLLVLGLLVGGWIAHDEWLESGKAMQATIKGVAWAALFGISTVATTFTSSRRCDGDCWLKKLYRRAKSRLTISHETPWNQR